MGSLTLVLDYFIRMINEYLIERVIVGQFTVPDMLQTCSTFHSGIEATGCEPIYYVIENTELCGLVSFKILFEICNYIFESPSITQ